MLNVPNAITLLRFALILPLAVLLQQRNYGTALALFVVSALSDVADGLVARRWNLRTRFGAIADPLADKLTMLTVTLVLAVQDWLPWWLALAVVLRDVVIVSGAIAYHLLIGRVEMAPSGLSRLNTGLEFLLLASALAIGAGQLNRGAWWDLLLLCTLTSVVLSGAHYVVAWSRKAAQQRRALG
jgi:cardiolipin synthase (CMP-forming)